MLESHEEAQHNFVFFLTLKLTKILCKMADNERRAQQQQQQN